MLRIAKTVAALGCAPPVFAAHWTLAVADFPRFEYDEMVVRGAGDVIAGAHPLNPEILDAFKIANNWRELHAYPMRSVRHQLIAYMHHLKLEGITGARLKRMQAIRRKLVRSGIHLDKLQDLGGCRVILPRIADVKTLVEALRKKSRHCLRAESDYIVKPKADGYRSHHLMYNYTGLGPAKVYSDRRIEIQIRSRLQHAWATAVEAVGLLRGEDLKGNKGSPDWLRLFKLVSAEFAVAEGCPEPPDVPRQADRMAEIQALDESLEATPTLENLSHAVQWTDIAVQSKMRPTYYLIKYENITNLVSVEPYFAPKKAMMKYENAEAIDNKTDGHTSNIVLVEADKLDNLKEAYPNYFGDVQLFKMQLKNITKGKGAREFVVKPQATVRPRPRESVDFLWLKRRIRWR